MALSCGTYVTYPAVALRPIVPGVTHPGTSFSCSQPVRPVLASNQAHLGVVTSSSCPCVFYQGIVQDCTGGGGRLLNVIGVSLDRSRF